MISLTVQDYRVDRQTHKRKPTESNSTNLAGQAVNTSQNIEKATQVLDVSSYYDSVVAYGPKMVKPLHAGHSLVNFLV